GEVVRHDAHREIPHSALRIPHHRTTTTPFMYGCGVQWYLYVPARSKRRTNVARCASRPESGPSSKVTECSRGSALVQPTASPTATVTVSVRKRNPWISTAAAAGPPAASAGAVGRWNHGLKRERWSGIVNSKP